MVQLGDILYCCRLSGKYSKKTLEQLEALKILTPDLRKIILDNFGDYAREIGRILNTGVGDNPMLDK